eukprot:354463-Chlamydomonas_euryale.AAC.8
MGSRTHHTSHTLPTGAKAGTRMKSFPMYEFSPNVPPTRKAASIPVRWRLSPQRAMLDKKEDKRGMRFGVTQEQVDTERMGVTLADECGRDTGGWVWT